MADKYNTIVIGAGPGGYVAALRLASQGLRIALVDYQQLGGTCLNRGCIPTKALLHSSEIVANMLHGKPHGITVNDWSLDFPALIKRKDSVIARLRSGVAGLLKGRKVDVFAGRARLLSPTSVHIDLNDGPSHTLSCENIIIATGCEPVVPTAFPQDRSRAMTSTEILELDQLPESLLIVGAGIIGCEFATVFCELGTQVTIVEMLERPLPMADADISAALTKNFKAAGIQLHIPDAVEKMEITPGSSSSSGPGAVACKLASGKTVTAARALIAIGRRPITSGLGLEDVGIRLENGFIAVDDYCCTNIGNIYAIGDVTGKFQLAHVASRQATVAANNIMGIEDTEDYTVVPAAVYTHPEIAWVGLTLEQAKQNGLDARAAAFPMAASGMAQAYNETAGFVKIIADADDVILGAHLMCPHASDVVQEIAVLMKSECTLHELAGTIHGHPTFAEALVEATDNLLGRPLHSH